MRSPRSACARPPPPTRWSAAPAPPTRTPSASTTASAKSRSRCSSRATCASSCSAPTSSGWSAWRDACPAICPRRRSPRREEPSGPCGQLDRGKDGQGRVRARHIPQRGGAPDRRTRSPRAAPRPKPRPSRPSAPSTARRSPAGWRPARRATLGEQASKATMAGFAAEISALAIRYGLHSAPEPRRPRIRLQGRVRSEQARRHPQAALRLPVPEPRSGARLGAPEGRALRSAALAHDRPDPPRRSR